MLVDRLAGELQKGLTVTGWKVLKMNLSAAWVHVPLEHKPL